MCCLVKIKQQYVHVNSKVAKNTEGKNMKAYIFSLYLLSTVCMVTMVMGPYFQ